MKTRVWRVVLVLHDDPGHDKDGQSVPFLTKNELRHVLQDADLRSQGVVIKDVEFKLMGHIPAAPTTQHPRKSHQMALVPHRGRGVRKAVKP